MDIHKLKAIGAGHKAALTKLFKKCEEAKEQQISENLDLQVLLDTLSEKQRQLNALNEQILNATSEDNVEQEIIDTDEYNMNIDLKIKQFRNFVISQTTHPVHSQIYAPPSSSVQHLFVPHSDSINQAQNTAQFSIQQAFPSSSSINSQSHRLPKLSLPKFNGNILQWQSFWDSYESAVHSNPTLDDVQKFNYLKAQLEDEASQTIAGFALTNANYAEAVKLLKERFGQPHKITNAYMQAMLNMPSPKNSLSSLRNYYDTLETYIRGLEALGQSGDTFGALLVPIVLNKLPVEIRKHLARENGSNNWKLSDLRQAISNEINIMEAGESAATDIFPSTATFLTGTKYSKANRNMQPQMTHQSIKSKPCIFCSDVHDPIKCTKVSDYDKRMSIVKQKQMCFNCLGSHRINACKSQFRCRECNKKHHTSLCKERIKTNSGPNPTTSHKTSVNVVNDNDDSEREDNVINLHASNVQARSHVLLKTAVAPVCSEYQCFDANILFDEGAQRSFVTEELAGKLNLKEVGVEAINLSAFGGTSNGTRYLSKATVHLQSDKGEKIPVDVLIVPKIATPLQLHFRKSISGLKYLNGLKLAHPVSTDDTFEISLLIGADYYWNIVENKTVRGNGPTAVKSKIGYLLSGPVHGDVNKSTNTNMLNIITSHKKEEFDIESFWKLESLGINASETQSEDLDFHQLYQMQSIEFRNDKYYAKLPWKPNHEPLPTNYHVAKKRTENIVRKLSQEPEMLKRYGAIIEEQERRGFIEKVVLQDDTNGSNNIHYIPHHPVKKDSATTPIRIVYDCSCRQSNNAPSLNDCLIGTPPFINDLSKLLVRFRLNKYAISTDIEKAFLHVGLSEQDRDATRFFWLSDSNNPRSPLAVYRFKTVLFGATCSPFILSATLLKHLRESDTEIAKTLERDLYVDNILSSVPQEEDVISYYTDARKLMSSAGFNLRSWTSNSRSLRELAAAENVLDTDLETKILGMRWNVESDRILYPKFTCSVPQNYEISKREILKQSSKIYDPLGILSPVTIRAKLLMQRLWKEGTEWDDKLNAEIHDVWNDLSADLERVTKYEMPRCYFSTQSPPSCYTLHVFTDASLKAYGAVAYLCNGRESAIVMAKTRVAPLKQLTLPQLELMAALIGARLGNHLTSTIEVTDTIYWSDSQIVLCWLKSKKLLKRFIRNRVDQIGELSKSGVWRYCPTESNPADLLTRGMTANQFERSSLWLKGPKWLTDHSEWPISSQNETTTLSTVEDTIGEMNENNNTQSEIDKSGIDKIITISRFSSHAKLLRVTAYVKRFAHNCRNDKMCRNTGPIESSELQEAEKTWIRNCQEMEYNTEIKYLKSNTGINIPARVRHLRLFLDDSGLLRSEGRMHNAPIEDSAKFPILLPKYHYFTNLVVNDAHRIVLHSGVNSTINQLRQTFWIPAIRQCVKKILNKCVVCRKVVGIPYRAPNPPPLSKMRLQEAPPFMVTGVDYTGALHVRNENGNLRKAYICLFTCASTRAVHLEIISDLSLECFLHAFRRFVSRKSLPKTVISDNASTYIAASENLRQLFESTELKEQMSLRGVEWKFIPKRAPWYGGWWERLIGLTKTSIKKVLGRSQVDMETLTTIITEIESILNDRPLTYISSDVNDNEALTPAHLLYGRRISSLPYPRLEQDEISDPSFNEYETLSKRAKRQNLLIKHFWNRWKAEYLTSLREFHRSNGNNDQTIKVGDIVQIHEDSSRVLWRIGIVKKLITGNDGLVRAAIVRINKIDTTRPITKLYPLEVSYDGIDEGNCVDSAADSSVETPVLRTSRIASEKAKRRIQDCLKDSDDLDNNT